MLKYSVVLAAALFAVAVPVAGQSPMPFPEFEAKRIKPPVLGAKQRITIQIAPETPKTTSTEAMPEPENQVYGSIERFAWFWDSVSPSLEESGPGRLEDALLAIRAQGGIQTPRLQLLQDIAAAHGVPILMSTVGTDVSPALVLAVIAIESSGREEAISRVGAQGLMQLMPDTADRFGVSDSFVASENIAGGVQYLDWLMGEFDRDPIMVLAGYNAGEGLLRNYEGVPPFAETRDYVPKVLAAFELARGLCKTPPELISDGCVFVTMSP